MLTGNVLAMKAVRTYYPTRDGEGTATVYSLIGTSAVPVSFAIDQWLTRIGDGAPLLSPQSSATGRHNDMSVMLIHVDTRGRKFGTTDGIIAPDLKH